MTLVIVDAANVVGSRPDGWWRDRPGAARRLVDRIAAALLRDPTALAAAFDVPADDLQVTVVLEGAARAGVPAGEQPGVPLRVVHAERDGDSTIAQLAADAAGADTVVVTADRGLRDRVHAAGARAVGPATLLTALDALDAR
jgi:hypothetical protein